MRCCRLTKYSLECTEELAAGKSRSLPSDSYASTGAVDGCQALLATVLATIRLSRRQAGVYRGYRRRVGRSILLGLEFLVAGDIIRTVAVAPTYKSVGVLAVIVGIRTFLSFSLELEITGRWPWQKPVAEAKD